jgi:hypothetical protein
MDLNVFLLAEDKPFHNMRLITQFLILFLHWSTLKQHGDVSKDFSKDCVLDKFGKSNLAEGGQFNVQ